MAIRRHSRGRYSSQTFQHNQVHTIIAGQGFSDLEKLAEAADRVWEARLSTTNIHNLHTADQPLASMEAITRPKYQPSRRVGPSSTAPPVVCYYHTRFSPQARNFNLSASSPPCSQSRETIKSVARRGSSWLFSSG